MQSEEIQQIYQLKKRIRVIQSEEGQPLEIKKKKTLRSIDIDLNEKDKFLTKIQPYHYFQEEVSSEQSEIESIASSELFIKNQVNENQLKAHQKRAPFYRSLPKLPSQLQTLLQKDSLCMSYNKFTHPQITYVLQNSDKYQRRSQKRRQIQKLRHLYLNWCKIQKIIFLLNNNTFSRLKTLSIGGNYTYSIQELINLEAPELQELNLWNNHLTSIKALRKMVWPSVRSIDMNSNNIVETKGMRHFSQRAMEKFNLDQNIISNLDDLVCCFSKSQVKLSILANEELVKVMGKPHERRRKKIHLINVPLSYAKYC